MEPENKIVTLNLRGVLFNIRLDDIIYIETKNHNCLLHTVMGVLETGTTTRMKDLTKILTPPRFLHSHRSYIVNLSHVDKIDRDFYMRGGGVAYIRNSDTTKCIKLYKEWLSLEAEKEAERCLMSEDNTLPENRLITQNELKRYLLTVETFVTNGDYDKLKEYLSKTIERLSDG